MAKRSRADNRRAVHGRIRKKVSGTAERPRLAVYRSTKHIYVQVIDDINGTTLVSASSVEKDLKGKNGGNIEGAKAVGKAIAQRAISEGITQVVFDRGGFLYHGRVKALIDATREAGLNNDSNGSVSAPVEEKKEEPKEEKKAEKKDSKKKEKKTQKKDDKPEAKEDKKAAAEKKKEEPKDESEELKEGDDEE
jgi:large subunit ribosomal protein L18